ncbi:S8 family serine peptidase [Streptomyces canus]
MRLNAYCRRVAPSGGERYRDGTSDATAFVSAAAALLRSKFPAPSAGR